MKKSLIIILTITILLTLCACSNNGKNEIQTSTTHFEENIKISTTNATEETKASMDIEINGKTFNAEFYDNETAKTFAYMLPLTINMEELHGNKKYHYFDSSLPTESENVGSIKAGDVMLYGSDCLVLFYDTFNTSYNYTRIGYITDTTELKSVMGNGNVTVKFLLK